ASIEQKSFLLVECDGANTKGCSVTIHDLAAIKDFADHSVDIGMVDVPTLGAVHAKRSRHGLRTLPRDRHRVGITADLPAGWVKHGGLQNELGFVVGAV